MARHSHAVRGERLFAEVVDGIQDLAKAELASLRAEAVSAGQGGWRLEHPAPFELAKRLKLVSSLYVELRFAVPRPKALLGDEAMRRLVAVVKAVARHDQVTSFRFAAAGASSPVFERLGQALAAAAGLEHEHETGSLLLRVRPYGRERDPRQPATDRGGWEVLVRLTGKPLSVRQWRVCNRPGGINSTVAVAMNQLVGGARAENYVNLMCGSGTLMVERALVGNHARLVGFDNDPTAVDCARENLLAGGIEQFELFRADVATLHGRPELAASFEQLTADAPWGDAVGEHGANADLYQALVRSAAWLAPVGARFALLSHEVRLLERLLPQNTDWRVESSRRVSHGGHKPSLLLLRRV